jgi:hypothetical protein
MFSYLPARMPLRAALLLLLTFNLLLAAFYIGIDYQYVFHSDAAAANLLAQEMRETGSFFPTDWNYVNNDLWVLNMQVYLVPLVGWFANGYQLHAVISVLSVGLVLLGTWLLGSIAGLSTNARLAALALFAAGISPNMAENLYGQAAYGTLYYSGCLVLYGSWRYLQGGRGRWLGAALAVLMALSLFWANPQRAAVYFGVPTAVGAAVLLLQRRLQPRDGLPAARPLGLLLGLVLVALAGAMLHNHTLQEVNVSAGLTQAQWLSFDAMVQSTLATVRGMLSLLCGLPPAGGQVMELMGALYALRLLAGVVLLAVLPWSLARCLSWQHPGRVFLASGALCAMVICLFIYITTTIPVAGSPEASIRYVVPPLLCIIVLAVGVLLDQRQGSQLLRFSGAGALAILLLSGVAAYNVHDAGTYLQHSQQAQDSYKLRLMNFLHGQGLQYGYSNFWAAGETTVLSRGSVRVRQIQIIDGLPMPHRHLASDRWYRPSAWQGPTFLMLNPEEAPLVDMPRLLALTGAPQRRLEFERWQVLVFDHNIAADLSLWDNAAERPVTFPINAHSAHLAGRFNPASGALESQAGEQGFLLFGQNFRLQAGHYQVSFELEAEGDAAPFAKLDVASHSGTRIHAEQMLSQAGRRRVSVPFVLAQRADAVEFRVFSTGAGALKLYGVTLTHQPPVAPGK